MSEKQFLAARKNEFCASVRRFGLGWAEKVVAHTAGQFEFPPTAENFPNQPKIFPANLVGDLIGNSCGTAVFCHNGGS
jgi:hypothetical protein